MTRLLEMTAQASVLIAFTALLRALWLEKLPKRTFTALWLVAAIRMVLPFSLTVPAPAAPVSAAYRAVAQAAPAPVQNAFPWAAAAWLTGAVLCAGWFLFGHLRAMRRYREALPLDDPGAARFVQRFLPRRHVSVRLCQGLGTPLTYGVFRPVILLPADLDRRDRRRLAYILAHELTHIRRFHIPFKYLLTAAVCLHWFDPLAWVMYVLAGRDIELSCDEAVLRRARDGRAGYAMALIELEERRTLSPLLSGFGAKAVRERIRQIMRFRPAGAVSVVSAAALVLLSATVFAAAAESAPLSPPRLSEGFVMPTPTPVAYVTVVPARSTERPEANYVNLTPVPTGTPAPTAAAAVRTYEAPAATAAALPAAEPTPTPESTPAPVEVEPVYTPEPTEEPMAEPTPPPPEDAIPDGATPSPIPWAPATPPVVHGGPEVLTPTPPVIPDGATPAPVPQTPEPTAEPII